MYPFIRPHIKRAILATLITIPIGSMDAVIAWALKPYMDVVMIEKSVKASTYIPVLIVLFSLVQSFLNYAATYLNAWVGNKITNELKLVLFKKMMHYEPAFFDKNTSGTIQLRFNQDVNLACSGLLSNLKMFSTRFFSSISLIFVLFYNSWQLAILAVVVLFGALYPLATVKRRLKSIVKKSVMSGGELLTYYNEAFSGNRIITSYNLYPTMEGKFNSTLTNLFKLTMRMTKKMGIISPLMHFIVACGIAGVIWFGSYLIVTNKITPGGFVSFITALLMLYQPIKSIGTNLTNVQLAFMAMDRIFSLLDGEPNIKNKDNAKQLDTIKDKIEYKDVVFEYNDGVPVLKNVNLTIPKGKTTAFVGNSGGGKTTFVNLLPRFYDIKSGSITIDGVDIRDLDLYSLREKIAFVFQDNFLFTGTIRQNIMLGKEEASEKELKEAVTNACLDEFIDSLDKGLDTEIGERGVLLSGGQKQRIAIARAFIKDAPIVILDEATSALDNKSEAIVQKAIENLMNDRTVLVIAHRLSTVRHADKIVVVNHGVIAEEGTHEELLNKPEGIYSILYKTQFK
ncbi:MAG: ATP-binding cassette domain-containing protein [Alphaproteobacteria bacterium]|nr:ATP-binding cassette domain-containing protein [Alphaproteobacteria bacterium]